MSYPLTRSLVLLGALLALLNYFLVFDSGFFFPDRIGLRSLNDFFVQITLPLLTGHVATNEGIIFPLSVVLFSLAYWFFLSLSLVQTGLGIWTLRRYSRRTRKWSIALAICGLILILLFFVGVLLFLADFSLTFRLEGLSPQVGPWDIVQKALDPAFLWGVFVEVGRALWLPTLGFLLILVPNWLTQPQESFHQPQKRNSEAPRG